MVLEGGEGRVGDGFRVSERLSIVDTMSVSVYFEKPGMQRELLL